MSGAQRLHRYLFLLIFLCQFSCSSSKGEITIAFGGDVLFDRGIKQHANRIGFDKVFENVRQIFHQNDAVFINLECPLTTESNPSAKEYVFRGAPEFADVMKNAGITHVSLANNHIFDHGIYGLKETEKVLQSAGISASGVSTNSRSCHSLKFEIGAMSISFFSANLAVAERRLDEDKYVCSPSTEFLVYTIEEHRRKNKNSIIILSLHWGYEFREYPTSVQQKLARQLVDAGANIIVGHHPHVLQPIEEYNNAVIFYSLGNLIFDQQRPIARKTMIASVTIGSDNEISRINLFPLLIENGIPRRCTKPEWLKKEFNCKSIPIKIQYN